MNIIDQYRIVREFKVNIIAKLYEHSSKIIGHRCDIQDVNFEMEVVRVSYWGDDGALKDRVISISELVFTINDIEMEQKNENNQTDIK